MDREHPLLKTKHGKTLPYMYANGVYSGDMIFIETPTFTKLITSLLSDDEYRGLQAKLLKDPAAGDVIPGGGGLRKIRWGKQSSGKRGGIRTIYYWASAQDEIRMLLAYSKAESADLTPEQVKLLKQVVERWE